MLFVHKLLWDTWNVAHIARHAVVPEEVEAVCHSDAWSSQTYGGRLRVVGPTRRGRLLTVILAPEGRGVYYPITARPPSRAERQRYQDLKGRKAP